MSSPVQIIKLVKPPAGRTETFRASFDGTVKIDFTAIASEKITLCRDNKNQSLHVIFADDSQVIIEPFFDSMAVMPNFVFEMSPGQVLDSAEFASQFPITADQSVIPTVSRGPGESGAEFNDPSVDSLPPNTKLALLPPEELPPIVFHEAIPAPLPTEAFLLPTLPPPELQSRILHIEKDATVPGGTADVAGETISYTLAVTNQGNAAIANVVVDDPFTTNEAPVLTGAFNVGDTDQDGLLDVGETWTYTASHQVTQAELDAGTPIVNTATVTGDGATPDSDDASVAVAQSKILHIEKDATVPDGTADLTGETISYTLAVTNTGQCGDCRRGGGRSVHDQRGAGSESAPSTSATSTRTASWMWARPGPTRPAIR